MKEQRIKFIKQTVIMSIICWIVTIVTYMTGGLKDTPPTLWCADIILPFCSIMTLIANHIDK